uniref:Cullin-5 n=1 Tax=Strigamia maritima TaxID=126957 RepID=T1J995_STRMM
MQREVKYNDDSSFSEQLQSIHRTIVKILQMDSVSLTEWRNLLTDVYQVNVWHGPDEINQALMYDIKNTIHAATKKISIHSESQSLVKAYIKQWENFHIATKYVSIAFAALSRRITGKPNNHFNEETQKFMLDEWKSIILSDNTTNHLRNSVMELIDNERNGRESHANLIITLSESYIDVCTDSLDKLLVYRELFEMDYIESTRKFYQNLSEYLAVNGVVKYMKHANFKLSEEEERGIKYFKLSEVSQRALMRILPDLLVKPFTQSILAECSDMIKHNDIKNLQRMFRLMNLVVGGLEPVLSFLEEYILSVGLCDMVAAASTIVEDCDKYVQQLLDLFNRFTLLVDKAFSSDPRFLSSRDRAFRNIINDTTVFKLELGSTKRRIQSESKCPELLANFCDMLLRKTALSKKLTSVDIDGKLKDALLLLKYVDNKDVFMRYYKSHLTRRLILETSADWEKEEDMVGLLRDIGMPAEYVSKVEQMFKDIQVSGGLNEEFKQRSRVKDSISIRVLNAAAWARPSDRVSVSVPVELEDYISEMEDFYQLKYNGRKLMWYHHMSNGSIRFVNSVGKFDLDVTTFQIAVLFAWNMRPKERISYENLRLATELPDGELRKTIWSLVSIPTAKRNLILCHPEVKSPLEFKDDSEFWINDEFVLVRNGKVQKRGRINLIGRLQLSTEKSQEVDNEAIVRLREFRMQEAIVCIAKARKSISNVQLQSELIGILKNMFLPTKRMIKEQVEWLIERDYLARDKQDLNLLVYVA